MVGVVRPFRVPGSSPPRGPRAMSHVDVQVHVGATFPPIFQILTMFFYYMIKETLSEASESQNV